MKTGILGLCAIVSAIGLGEPASDKSGQKDAVRIEALPPVVIATVPATGSVDVDATNTKELRLTFSRKMRPEEFSFTTQSVETLTTLFPGGLRYEEDTHTFVIPCTLKSDRTYAFYFNVNAYPDCSGLVPPRIEKEGQATVTFQVTSASNDGFCDLDGRPAFPYLLVFETKAGDS